MSPRLRRSTFLHHWHGDIRSNISSKLAKPNPQTFFERGKDASHLSSRMVHFRQRSDREIRKHHSKGEHMIAFAKPVESCLAEVQALLARGQSHEAMVAAGRAYEQSQKKADMLGCYKALRLWAVCLMAQGNYLAAYQILCRAFLCAAYVPEQHAQLQGRLVREAADTLRSGTLYARAQEIAAVFEETMARMPAAQALALARHHLELARAEGEDHWFFGFATMLVATALANLREELHRAVLMAAAPQPLPQAGTTGAPTQRDVFQAEEEARAAFRTAREIAGDWGHSAAWLSINITQLQASLAWRV
jgi:hypothetical protein